MAETKKALVERKAKTMEDVYKRQVKNKFVIFDIADILAALFHVALEHFLGQSVLTSALDSTFQRLSLIHI